MKAIKNGFVMLVFFLLAGKLYAQDLNSKGLSVHTYLGLYYEGEEIKTYDVNEIYNVSFTDGYLIHNILSDGIVSDSQIYKVTNVQRKVTDGTNTFTFKATSGVSGSIYTYEIYMEDEQNVTLKLIQPDGSSSVYMGSFNILKTYKQ